jgi:hypothetical protein
MQTPLPKSLPVLVLWGEEDGAIEKRLSYGMQPHVPNLQVGDEYYIIGWSIERMCMYTYIIHIYIYI